MSAHKRFNGDIDRQTDGQRDGRTSIDLEKVIAIDLDGNEYFKGFLNSPLSQRQRKSSLTDRWTVGRTDRGTERYGKTSKPLN